MLASHLYTRWNSPAWHQYHQVHFQKGRICFQLPPCSALIGSCLEAGTPDPILGLCWEVGSEHGGLPSRGTMCSEWWGCSCSEPGNDWGAADTLQCPPNNWQAEINKVMHFPTFYHTGGKVGDLIVYKKTHHRVRGDGCIAGTLILQGKIKKTEARWKWDEASTLSEQRFPTAWTCI